MTLPNPTIDPIPQDEPDAVPSLWNARYTQIDANFQNLDGRSTNIEAEILAARNGQDSLDVVIDAITTQIGGINGTLNGLASPASIQSAVGLDWLYRNHRIVFELFTQGYTQKIHEDVAVIQGVLGDDSLDVEDTSGFKVGEDYILHDATDAVMVHVDAVLTSNRIRLSANLTKEWDETAKLGGTTLVDKESGGVDAVDGSQWISKAINLGEDNTMRSIVIRRTLNAGNIRLYFRDNFTTSWTERLWTWRRSGGGTSGVPEGFADYEYLVPMRGDGYLRIEVEDEDMVISHIVCLGGVTGLLGFINPELKPNAPTISEPTDTATGVSETPTIRLAGYSSPADDEFSKAQFQISTSNTFSTILHDSGEVESMTYSVPAGVLPANTTVYIRARVESSSDMWSDFSDDISFTTDTTYAYVTTPIVTTPTNGQTEIPEQPTFLTDAFSVVGGSDTQQSGRWQIRNESDTWSTILHDSGVDTVNKTNYTVPAGVLLPGQKKYVMRVKRTGSTLGDSEWSNDVHFTTKQTFANVIGIVLTATGGGAGAWQRIDENFNQLTTTQATFNNHPTYAGIIGQTIDGQSMVKIPKFYIKTGTVPSGAYSGKRYWMISDQPLSGFVIHPAFKDGGSDIDQFWVGKYQGTDDGGTKLGSKSGVAPLTSQTKASLLSKADARNTGGVTGFMVWSIYQLEAIKTLALIEMGGSDSQSLIAQGYVSGGSIKNTSDSDVIKAAWRGILGLWGNIFQYVQGVDRAADGSLTIWDKNGNESDQTTSLNIGSFSNNPLTLSTASGANYDLGFTFFPATVAAASSATIPDLFNGAVDVGAVYQALHGGHYAYGSSAGLFAMLFNAPNGMPYVGTRLAKI